MPGRCHPLYTPAVDRRGLPRIGEVPGGAEYAALLPPICVQGYEPGWALLNVQKPERELTVDDFDEDDLIVVPTLLTLDNSGTRRTILTSGGRLVVAILEAIRPFFSMLAPDHMTLDRRLAAQLPVDYRNRAEICFHQQRSRSNNVAARYHWYRDPYADSPKQSRRSAPGDRAATAAFVIRIRLRAGGPTLLAVFTMEDATTLAWCSVLAVRYPALLGGERFVMAELIADPMPERPADLSFVERWHVEILLDSPG